MRLFAINILFLGFAMNVYSADRIPRIVTVQDAIQLFEDSASHGKIEVSVNGVEWRYHDPDSLSVKISFDDQRAHKAFFTGYVTPSEVEQWIKQHKSEWILIRPGKETRIATFLNALEFCNNLQIPYSVTPVSTHPSLELIALPITKQK